MIGKKLGNYVANSLAGLFAAVFVSLNLTGIITLIVFVFAPLAFAEKDFAKYEAENAQCQSCHINQDLKQSIHATRPCTSCHNELGGVPHKNIVHGRELVRQVNVQCQQCHADIAGIYKDSVHALSVAEGKSGALCTDCHGAHDIMQKTNPEAKNYRLNIPETCLNCHDERIAQSYDYSFHGTSVKLGSEKGATCVDCHGAHEILGPEDSQSTVSKQNVPETCAECHLQTQANFADGNEHAIPQDKERSFSLWLIWKIFLGLIIFDLLKDGSIAIFELIRRIINSRKH